MIKSYAYYYGYGTGLRADDHGHVAGIVVRYQYNDYGINISVEEAEKLSAWLTRWAFQHRQAQGTTNVPPTRFKGGE